MASHGYLCASRSSTCASTMYSPASMSMSAKWLAMKPKVLIFDEPTRGIDVGAKFEIYSIIAALAAQGKSIIVISSEMPELLGITDRLYVMNEGRFVGELPTAEATQEKIMAMIVTSGEQTHGPGETIRA